MGFVYVDIITAHSLYIISSILTSYLSCLLQIFFTAILFYFSFLIFHVNENLDINNYPNIFFPSEDYLWVFFSFCYYIDSKYFNFTYLETILWPSYKICVPPQISKSIASSINIVYSVILLNFIHVFSCNKFICKICFILLCFPIYSIHVFSFIFIFLSIFIIYKLFL